jgi:hypothetical protein
MLGHFFDLGTDILGLVTTGVLAKNARASLLPLKK